MKTSKILILASVWFALAPVLIAQVPGVIRYQGVLEANGNNFNGAGQFKFALVNDGNPALVTFWSNDGTLDGSEPPNHVEVDVDHGVFAVALGDTSIPNMLTIPPTVFTNSGVHLRIWFRDGNGNDAFELLTPDQPITAVGYAMMAANVPFGSITENEIADGAVTGSKIAPNAITSSDIADVLTLQKLNLGGLNWDGSLNLFAQPSGGGGIINPSGALRGIMEADKFGSELDLFQSNGSTGAVLSARAPGAALRLWDGLGTMTAFLGAANGGGDLNLYQVNGNPGIKLDGDRAAYNQPSAGGEISVHTAGGGIGLLLDGQHNDAGRIQLRQPGNTLAYVDLFGRGAGDGGEVWVNDANARTRVILQGVGDNSAGGAIGVRHANGTETIHLAGGQDSNSGARLEMSQANGALTVILDGEVGNGGGGYLQLRKGDGTATITLDSDAAGEGTITTQVLQITGGSDLSEKFDIQPVGKALEPGMIVCIDPENPAKLVVSQRAYDSTVAGVISGAGGVKPGMLMSQAGSMADGKHPVALTGRVYCHVDAGYGAIRPGDLITTSETPGHGMKVTDRSNANGAILGKAMTGLQEGRGLVLLLVSLQ